MSDIMTPIPFGELLHWILEEHGKYNTVFGIHKPYKADKNRNLSLFGEKMETPYGPAAGPNTQLTQNIVASYYTGSRFFELKTVQVIDGEDLPVNKPCIKADDECYNVEWSTELRVQDAFAEYVKAWFLLKIISKEFDLGSPDGFMFNMSVGYDLKGIKTKKIDDFIEGLKDASDTEIFKDCKQEALKSLNRFKKVTKEDIEAITPHICTSITLSTLHGCPPEEIEKIATYLLKEKHLNTFIKCNPTLLGYEFARKTMDDMGYDYVAFGDFHFKDDLQYEDAIPMLKRLQAMADGEKLSFGVKITNTFPVDVKQNELPGEEMYMSGRSLYPLSIALAAKLAEEFDGALRISYSGGADYHNIKQIFDAGIWPITMATTILKPGGYGRMVQIGEILDKSEFKSFEKVNKEAVRRLQKESITDKHHVKSVKPLPTRKMKKEVPLLDCFIAPCEEGCPIHQDITTYMKLTAEGKYKEALEVITDKNPLPFITGTICAHRCMSKCTRNFYEEPIQIRSTKLEAATGGFDEFMKALKTPEINVEGKTAVIGGGPAGLAVAYFLAKGGKKVTIFEKKDSLGGIIKHVIPEFRIPTDSIEKDIELVKAMGVEIILNTEITSIDEVKNMGYDSVVLAIGAWKEGNISLEAGTTLDALQFLEEFKIKEGNVSIGKNVAVIGGGNTAMDTARAAKATEGVEHVYLVYRRNKRYMPAEEEELILAEQDGVEFKELLAPVKLEGNTLVCHKVKLGDMDASGRRTPIETEEIINIPADTVIAAVGEKTDQAFYEANGITVDKKGKPYVNDECLTNIQGVYAVGDGLNGPATVVEAIRDGMKAAEAILEKEVKDEYIDEREAKTLYAKKGVIKHASVETKESERCLVCSAVCENCVDVCPNRANISIQVPGRVMTQIIHVDKMCNECGNCMSFCPYSSAPYKDKFTLFSTEKDFEHSENQGFVLLDGENMIFKVRVGNEIKTMNGFTQNAGINQGLKELISVVFNDYSYLF